MITCVCNKISDKQILQAVRSGMDFSDIQLEFGVATCCGSCEECARELVASQQTHGSPLTMQAVAP